MISSHAVTFAAAIGLGFLFGALAMAPSNGVSPCQSAYCVAFKSSDEAVVQSRSGADVQVSALQSACLFSVLETVHRADFSIGDLPPAQDDSR